MYPRNYIFSYTDLVHSSASEGLPLVSQPASHWAGPLDPASYSGSLCFGATYAPTDMNVGNVQNVENENVQNVENV